MKKSNLQICSNCGAENALFEKICKHCKHYLRATVVNIDLWKTTWQIFESPTIALTGVIHAEHKNFLGFLLVILALKLYSLVVIIQSSYEIIFPESDYFFMNLILQIIIYTIFIILFSFTVKNFFRRKRNSRFKDILAVTVFSFTPAILAFIILVPVQFGIFGVHWFTYNPSPFIIKNSLAYILAAVEVIMIFWSIFIFLKGMYLQSNSWFITILLFLIFTGTFSLLAFYIPYVII